MKKSTYSKLVPKLISNNVDNFDEASRWVLDRNRIPYDDNRHGPGLYVIPVNKATGLTGTFNQPAWLMTDCILSRTPTIINFMEARCPPGNRLYPADPEARKVVEDLVKMCQTKLMGQVTDWAYSILLPHKNLTLPVFKEGIPWYEKLLFTLNYKKIAQGLSAGLGLKPGITAEALANVKAVPRATCSCTARTMSGSA